MATRGVQSTLQSVSQRCYFAYLFWILFAVQAGASVAAYEVFDIPVSTETDSVEYIRTADNVLAGNGFSIAETAPWMPNAFRTPGPLIINVPLRFLAARSDVAALIISRLVLLGAALLTVRLASQLGLSSFAWGAGALFVVMPSIAYYSFLPYSTEIPYAVACGLFFVASLAYLTHGTLGRLGLIGLAAMYALYLRPAALFVLVAYFVVATIISFVTIHQARRRILLAGVSCLLGTLLAYGTWAHRNHNIFGQFQFSTVGGYNLLHFNARGMEPHLDDIGKQELQTALAKHPTFLQRYMGYDQFILANHQAKAGMDLIFKYPSAFLRSHFVGVIQSFFLFIPSALGTRSSITVVGASLVHSATAVIGVIGLAIFWKVFSDLQRVTLILILTVGIVSALTGGALFSPRFRIPLDIMFSIGCALFVMRVMRKEINVKMETS